MYLLASFNFAKLFFSYGDQYLQHFNFILVIDEKTSIEDLEWMLVQALLFRAVVVAYEVCSFIYINLIFMIIISKNFNDQASLTLHVYVNKTCISKVLNFCIWKNFWYKFLQSVKKNLLCKYCFRGRK